MVEHKPRKVSFLGTKRIPRTVKVDFHVSQCPLCILPARESLLYEDDLIYLVETKELKGHSVRAMAVIKAHAAEPTFEERILCTVRLYEYMKAHTGGFYLVDNSFCSIPGHWHLMACDLEGGGDPMLYSTPRVMLP